MGKKPAFWKALAIGTVLQGCAQGVLETSPQTTNCTPLPESACRKRVWWSMLPELEVAHFGEDKSTVVAVFNFSQESQRVSISYAAKEASEASLFEARAGDIYGVENGTLYIGDIHFQENWKYVFLYLAEKEVKTQTVNLLVAGEEGSKLEQVVLNSNCTERRYDVEALRKGITEAGVAISSTAGTEVKTNLPPYATVNSILFPEYEYGIDGILIQKAESSENYTHAIVHFFEDAVKCR